MNLQCDTSPLERQGGRAEERDLNKERTTEMNSISLEITWMPTDAGEKLSPLRTGEGTEKIRTRVLLLQKVLY